ncbi:hypothetical protein RTBOTA2_001365 [Rhodotorula toruloides]|uniref:Proteophosphoglycan ppg4 n=1 Tax=Rhodotorula toruloides TaxID=5286 RepID=A0A2T0A7S2_RHOTO|nr:hypothetical protein RTBOTA2_001365 [Rhodotorula toruloides]PRQ74047.1 hypothetical protein AAT19DRAFT_15614 [Rhodotorula toruloides]
MPVAQPPQRIQIGSRFPAWDTEESCFELAFRKGAARRDFAPSWEDTKYEPTTTHAFWGCAHTTNGKCSCTVQVRLLKDLDGISPFVLYAYFGHNHPSSGLSDNVRFACNEDMAGVRKELRTGASKEFARLKKLAETRKSKSKTSQVSLQQQLVMWDVWVAIGFKRARQFEKKMLDDGLVVEAFPSQGVLDDSLSPESDPLAHPLAAVSPLMMHVSNPAFALVPQTAEEQGGGKSKSGKGGKGKTGAGNKANGGAASAKKDQQPQSTPVTPNELLQVHVKTAGRPSQSSLALSPAPLKFTAEAVLAPPERAPAPVVSPSPSNRPSSGVSSGKRSSASIDSPATKKRKVKPSTSSGGIKQEVKKEEDELRVLAFKAHSSPATPSPSRAAPNPAFLAYLAALDTGGAVDYSIFASDLAHLGIKNHKALERVAATAENRKRLVKDLAKLRSTDKYALIMFEEDLKAKVEGGKDG